jgi:plastin-1
MWVLTDRKQLNALLKSQKAEHTLQTKAGKVTVKGSNANVSHTINEDERREFTSHINGVSNSRAVIMGLA